MKKIEYLKAVKSLLRSVVKQRRWLLANHKGFVDSKWASREINNIDYALPKLVDAERAKTYLAKKETVIRFLIPATNKRRHEELKMLIESQLN